MPVVLALFILLAVFLVPWDPSMPARLEEANWKMVLDHAVRHGWQFGVDVVFTFGPYGFLYTHLFHPETYAIVVAVWLALALLAALALASLLRGAPLAVRMLVPLAFVVALSFYYYPDVFFLALPLLCFFHAIRPGRSAWLSGALLLACGLSGLVKFSFAPLALGLALLVDARRILVEHRRVPAYSLGFLASVLVLFTLARQSPTNLGEFVSSSLRMAAGYSDAMQLSGPPLHVWTFLAVAVLGLAAAAAVEWRIRGLRRDGRAGAAVLLALALCLFVSFKAGFVRQDAHEALAWGGLVMAGVCAVSRVAPYLATRREQWIAAALVPALVGLAAAQAGYWRPRLDGRSFFEKRLLAVPPLALRSAWSLLSGERIAELERGRLRALARMRRAIRLPDLSGGVDAYPWHQMDVLAHGLRLKSRPVFESFAAYDASLVERNRAFLRGPEAPDHLLVSVDSIDGRFAPAEEGGSWLEFLSLYDPVDYSRPFAVLRRRENPRQLALSGERELRASFGEPIALPADVALVWAAVEIDRTPLGQIWNALFRMPVLELELQTGPGGEERHRFVPGAARAGFLLSPIVDDARAFRALMLPAEVRDRALRKRVTRVRILGSPLATRLYRQPFSLRLSALAIEADGASAR